jgi:hypothetical protein
MKKFIDIDKKEIVKIYKSIGQFTQRDTRTRHAYWRKLW